MAMKKAKSLENDDYEIHALYPEGQKYVDVYSCEANSDCTVCKTKCELGLHMNENIVGA